MSDDQGPKPSPGTPRPAIRNRRQRSPGFLRRVEVVTRGPVSIVVTAAFFIGAGVLGGRAGVLVASVWVSVLAVYCLVNFRHCREAHCVVTGIGWAGTSLLGFAAAAIPGQALAWYEPGVQAAIFLVTLGFGYALEGVVRAHTGDRFLR